MLYVHKKYNASEAGVWQVNSHMRQTNLSKFYS